MDKLRTVKLMLVFVFIISPLIKSTLGDGGDDQHKLENHGPNPVERAIGITNSINPLEKVRSWIKLAWLTFKPPDSERSEEGGGSSAGEVIKDAAAKSFETSKGTAERTAKVAGDAVHKTAEKVKRTVSTSAGHMGEL